MDVNSSSSVLSRSTKLESTSELSIRERWQKLQYDVQKLMTDSTTEPHRDIFHQSNQNDNDDDHKSHTSSFQLGIQLFGSLDAVDIERTVQEKIQQYENELQHITKELTVDRHHYKIDRLEEDESQENVSVTTEFLQMKLLFLKECSKARSLLDASIQQSSRYSTTNNTASRINVNHSFSNESTKETETDDPMEQSTISLLQSHQSLRTSYSILQTPPKSSTRFEYDEDTRPTSTENDDALLQKLKEPLYHMYDAIHASWRRQKIYLMTTMKQIWETTITHTSTSITVLHPKLTSTMKHPPLRTFFNVYHVLWKDQQDAEADQERSRDSKLTPPPPHDHYMFLMMQAILRQWTYQVQQDIWTPILQDMQQQLPSKMGTAASNTPDTLSRSILHDDTTTTGISNQEYRIEWTKSTNSTKAATTQTSSIASSDKPSQHPLQAVRVQHFQEALQFIQRIFTFIADHILFQKSGNGVGNHAVCQYIAQRFFGNGTTLSSTTLLNESTTAKDIRTVDGQYLYTDCIPRLGNDDDGLFLYSFLEILEEVFIPQDIIPQKELFDTLNIVSSQVHTILNPFVQELSTKFILPMTPGRERIVKFISNIDQLYVSHRRCQILNQARTIVTTNDYHNTITVGTNTDNNDDEYSTTKGLDFLPYHLQKNALDIFQLHKASISTTAHQILILGREIMDEVVATYNVVNTIHSTTTTAPNYHTAFPYLQVFPSILYRSARDVFDLYRMIVPVKYQYEISHVPRTAAIHHNDGVFMAHHCSIIGLEYKNKFMFDNANGGYNVIDKENNGHDSSNNNDTTLSNDIDVDDVDSNHSQKQRDKLFRQTCVFVDMVPLFRDIADKSMNHMIQLQCQQITELVGERITLFGYSLKSNEIVVEWSDATEIAYDAGLYHLRHIYQIWSPPVLSNDVFNRVTGYLIDIFLTLYLDQIAKATDISSVACPFLHTFFQRVIYDLDLLWQTCPNTNKSKQYYSRVWDKFIVIGQFMNMSMSDIQDGLSNGIFRTITGPELSKLITSCFDDTPKRRALLHLISSNQ